MISQMRWTSYSVIRGDQPHLLIEVVLGKLLHQVILFEDHLEDVDAHHLMLHQHFGIAVSHVERIQMTLRDVAHVVHQPSDTNAQLLLLGDVQLRLHSLQSLDKHFRQMIHANAVLESSVHLRINRKANRSCVAPG